MHISKCDICEKEIKDGKIAVGVGYLVRADLCEKCGGPIIAFLKKHKLLGENKP